LRIVRRIGKANRGIKGKICGETKDRKQVLRPDLRRARSPALSHKTWKAKHGGNGSETELRKRESSLVAEVGGGKSTTRKRGEVFPVDRE